MPFSSVVVTSGCARAHATSHKADTDVESRIMPVSSSHSLNPRNLNSECAEPRVEIQCRTERKTKERGVKQAGARVEVS